MSTDDNHSTKSAALNPAGDDATTVNNTLSRASSKIVDIYEDDAIDPVYRAKVHVLNNAMQEIGMGKYQVRPRRSTGWSGNEEILTCFVQWLLWAVAGFGWFADSVWPVS